MTAALTKEQLIEVVHGKELAAGARLSFSGVEYSSKEIKGGELFVALKGEKTHGHQFLKDAYDRGAALFLIEDASLAEGFPEVGRLVLVEDTMKAFWSLASWWRKEAGCRVLSITGSVGKTTCKEITAAILLKAGVGTYSMKSHNNHVGVPYTILRMKKEEPWTVLEMGMNHAGELSTLSKIARPDLSAITKIAPAHIEAFGSVEAIARAKLEVLDGMDSGSPIILNGDDEILEKVYGDFAGGSRRPVYRFGTSSGCDCRISSIESRGLSGIAFSLELDGTKIDVSMSALGRQTAFNAACAALCAKRLLPSLGMDVIKAGLESFRSPLMRLNLKHLTNDRILIDDSYNANPTSMSAFLEFAGDLSCGGKKKVGIIIGDMLELGDDSARYHLEIGEKVSAASPAFVIGVGNQKENLLRESAGKGVRVFSAASPEDAGDLAIGEQFDIIMIKASRSIGLDRAAGRIMEKLAASVP